MNEVVVVDALRTPFGRAGWRGVFKDITAVELAVAAIKALMERTKIDPEEIEHLVVGVSVCQQALTATWSSRRACLKAPALIEPTANAPPLWKPSLRRRL